MDPVTFYRLGEIRHAEILKQAARDHQSPLRIKQAATMPIGRLLLAWGARLIGPSGCASVASGGYRITVCSAQST